MEKKRRKREKEENRKTWICNFPFQHNENNSCIYDCLHFQIRYCLILSSEIKAKILKHGFKILKSIFYFLLVENMIRANQIYLQMYIRQFVYKTFLWQTFGLFKQKKSEYTLSQINVQLAK